MLLISAAATIYSNWQTAQRGVLAARAACERSKFDRTDNSTGWEIARSARQRAADTPTATKDEKEFNGNAATSYAGLRDTLGQRSMLDCDAAFPDAPVFTLTPPKAPEIPVVPPYKIEKGK